MKVTTMTLDEFRDKFMKTSKYFDFDKFSITCNKCQSKNVEFGGRTQRDESNCWYPEDHADFKLILVCKCHDCGNAFVLENNNYPDDDISRNSDKHEVEL